MEHKQVQKLHQAVATIQNQEKGKFLQRFFKTGKGEYGEGDVFAGLSVPQSRRIAKQFADMNLSDLNKLLKSKIHEERLIALIILYQQFAKATPREKHLIYEFYLAHTKQINNWDLVDVSSPRIVGAYLAQNKLERPILYQLAKSQNLWERRIAIISTLYFIKILKQSADTFYIAEILLTDKEDLIHKAVGWMLREVGKEISRPKLAEFLAKHYQTMPRTMLRYAIEHFPKEKRLAYLHGRI